MTKPQPSARNRFVAFMREHGAIVAVLLVASWLRLVGIEFGLPALNDPDEPLFVMLAYGMIERGSLDPQWFGHPGTITLYCLALVMVAVAGIGIATGRYEGIEQFAHAVYLDPGMIILPGRIFIALNGVACVWITYLIGKRLWGQKQGLVAAVLLSVNAVHITWSQVIRTDVQASLFMLLCLLSAVRMLQHGDRRSYVLAGAFAGLACATKWPAAVVILGPLSVACWRCATAQGRWQDIPVLLLSAGATLVAVSPFLLISYDVVIADLAGEARAFHPGATGSGLIGNLACYVTGPLAQSLGWFGLAWACIATIAAVIRAPGFRLVIAPVLFAFVLLISAQNLWWERWLVPVLPLLALALSWSIVGAAAWAKARRYHPAINIVLTLAVAFSLGAPMLAETRNRSFERAYDTRQAAAEWLSRNAPTGATIVLEHAGFDVLQGPWKVKFPLGTAGCVDAKAVLGGKISATEVETSQNGSPVIDLGHVEPSMAESCRADFYVLSNIRRYEAERHLFPGAYATYQEVLGESRQVAEFGPLPGRRGGPDVLIFERQNALTAAQK